MNANQVAWLVVTGVIALVFLVWLLLFFSVVLLYVQAVSCGVRVSITQLIGMHLRRTPPRLIVHTAVALRQQGVKFLVSELESRYLAHATGQDLTPHQLATLYLEKQGKAE